MKFSLVTCELVDVEALVSREDGDYLVELNWPEGYTPSDKERDKTLKEAMIEYDMRLSRA